MRTPIYPTCNASSLSILMQHFLSCIPNFVLYVHLDPTLRKQSSHRIVNIKHKNVFKLLDGLYSEKNQLVYYETIHFIVDTFICN